MQSVDILGDDVLDVAGVEQCFERHMALGWNGLAKRNVELRLLALFLQRPNTLRTTVNRAIFELNWTERLDGFAARRQPLAFYRTESPEFPPVC